MCSSVTLRVVVSCRRVVTMTPRVRAFVLIQLEAIFKIAGIQSVAP